VSLILGIAKPVRAGAKSTTLVLALLLLVAEARFVAAQPVSETRFSRVTADPYGRMNLASADLGVTIRAHSTLWASRHHPAYVLGGRVGTPVEKWVSGLDDPAPWIEVEFDRPRRVDSVDLVFAGVRESPDLTMRDYSVECFALGRRVASTEVRGNEAARAHVALACDGGTRVRITFPLERGGPRDLARVYGLEVWGSA
jgi:hypothetical protein